MSSPQANEPEAVPELLRRCKDCDHTPFTSSDEYHAHRTLHQLRADVTLPDGSTQIITRLNESASWLCPEYACQYTSPFILRLRAHLRHQRQKRRRQEDEQQAEQQTDREGSLAASNDAQSPPTSSIRNPSSTSARVVRRRLNTEEGDPVSRVSRAFERVLASFEC